MTKIIHRRGLPLEIIFTVTESDTPKDITGYKIFFTIKKPDRIFSDDDSDSVYAVVKKTITNHSDAANGETTIAATAADMDFIPGKYVYDIAILDDGGIPYATDFDELELKPRVTETIE